MLEICNSNYLKWNGIKGYNKAEKMYMRCCSYCAVIVSILRDNAK